jgi:hypothetical protein
LLRQPPMGSFFHTLKTELVHHRHYKTRARPSTISSPSPRASTTNPAPFRNPRSRPDRDGAKSRLELPAFSGEDQTPTLKARASKGDWLHEISMTATESKSTQQGETEGLHGRVPENSRGQRHDVITPILLS